MKAPKVLILSAPGTNCAVETSNAFSDLGARPEIVGLHLFKEKRVRLLDYDIFVIPGGFSYGDEISAGKILAAQVKLHIGDLKNFIRMGRPVIGICNGFQALVKAGVLPFSPSCEQSASLITNDSGRFENRWVHLRINTQNPSLFFRGLPEMIELPVAHGEGKLVLRSPKQLEDLKRNRSIAMQYVSDDGKIAPYPANPNGSVFNIAALTNPDGNCLGMMPHPERYTKIHHHPNWTRQTFQKQAFGLAILKNAVDYCRG